MLGKQYDDDALLQSYFARTLPEDLRRSMTPAPDELGGGYFNQFQQQDRLNEPELTQWDTGGLRLDNNRGFLHCGRRLRPWPRSASWWRRHTNEQKITEISRVHQLVLNYFVPPSLDVYSGPLVMTDGAARLLLSLDVLSLDAMGAWGGKSRWRHFSHEVEGRLRNVNDSGLRFCVEAAGNALEHAREWLTRAMENLATMEAEASQFAQHGVDFIRDGTDLDDTRLLT